MVCTLNPRNTPPKHIFRKLFVTLINTYGITLDKVPKINIAICGLQNSPLIFGLMSFTPRQILSQMFGVKSSASTGLTPTHAQTTTTKYQTKYLESFTSGKVMCSPRPVQLSGLNPFANKCLMCPPLNLIPSPGGWSTPSAKCDPYFI